MLLLNSVLYFKSGRERERGDARHHLDMSCSPALRVLSLKHRFGGTRQGRTAFKCRDHDHPQPIRPFHTTTQRAGIFANVRNAFWNIYYGDDHINPKKILERKYLYVALMANHLRNLRLAAPDGRGDKQELHEQTIRELEEKDLDGTTNVDLRKELQTYLHPQINAIVEAFRRVDERLNIPPSAEIDEEVDLSAETEYKEILFGEYNLTQHQMQDSVNSTSDETSSERSLPFFRRKLGAIETILAHFGWSQQSTTSKSGTFNDDQTLPSVDDFGMDVSSVGENNLRLIRKYQAMNLCRSALIRDELGYSVLCLRSNIPGGGRGLFLDGSALAGSVVAFQPGDVWPKEHLITDAPDVVEHFESGDNDLQISLRFDDYLVDARQSPVTVLTREGFLNPWALGHMINHPNPPTMPNCQSTMLNFTGSQKLGDLVHYIPNTYAREPTWRSRFFDDRQDVVMHGLCLIARQDACNEELLYDYRLQSEETPEWYKFVDYGEGWEDDQIVFFRDDWRKDKQEKNEDKKQ